jgi:exodeoxyribonuclease VII large subunit
VTARVVQIGLLTTYIRELLETDDLLADLWVEGEVSDAYRAQSGHVYFTLKDANAILKCVLFRNEAARQVHLPRPGEQIAAHGRVSVYDRDGRYQLYTDIVQPAGIGALALELALLRQRLEAEGLFEPSRKRPIPVPARFIGVVTSPNGAVWHDIQHVVERRYPLSELILAPSSVQGERAPESIVAAIEALQLDGRADVIIVARGGGSAEDLASFNDERVVRAIFACRIPVVSGIGHETDWTLADEVADLRAPTPSAAAELCTPSIIDIAERLQSMAERLSQAASEVIYFRQQALLRRIGEVKQSAPIDAIASLRQSAAARRLALSQSVQQTLGNSRADVVANSNRLSHLKSAILAERYSAISIREAALFALDPLAVLARGYSVLSKESDGRPISSIADIRLGDKLKTTLRDGKIGSSVDWTQCT